MGDYAAQNSTSAHVDASLLTRLAAAKEAVWFRIGVLQSTMNDRDRALEAFERVLAVNPGNVRAMTQAGAVLAKKEMYPQAVAYLQRAIQAESTCGEAWAVLAHCYVMTDDLQKAYQAYQSALSHLPNPKDPNLWYGIGLLYDRYGSLEHALEAFLLVLSIAPDFERADEVCFCIGIIYKEQQNFDDALKYFNKVVIAANPPPPLTRADGWYQIGHVSELKRDIPAALEMYKQALAENPKHPKTLQNLGWLEHQHNQKSAEAIRLLKMSAELDSTDGQTWYLLGRVYMALREFRQAYDAYQQAVYRDGRNATFWCSIGVLYYQMNQYRDAMDAYSRAIILNPHVSEVWYDLGTLYESCGQNDDAIDAYRRAAKLAPDNTQITARLNVLENNANPSIDQQQGQQPQQQQPQQTQGLHQSGSQPMSSVPIPISQPQPQMHPEMHSSQHGEGMNSSIGRQPMQGISSNIRRPNTSGQSPTHLHPPTHLNPPTSLPQPRHSIGLSAPSTSAPVEVAPIHPLPSSGGLSEIHPVGSNNASNYQNHDQSPQTGAHPSSGNGSSNVNALSSITSQPLTTSQGPSTMLPPISSSALEPINPLPSRSSPGSHIQNSSHQPLRRQEGIQSHVILPSTKDGQNGHHQSTPGPRIPSPRPSQPMHSPQKQPLHSDKQGGHSQSQQGGYASNGVGPNENQTKTNQSSITSPGERSHHSHPSQPPTSMAQIPSLASLPSLPPVQQQQSNEEAEKSDRHRRMSSEREDRDHNAAMDTGNTAQYSNQGDNNIRSDYESAEQRGKDNRLPKISPRNNEGGNEGSGTAHEDSNRGGFSTPMPSSSLSRDRIPSIRDSVGDGGSSAPSSSRQMSLHEVTRQDNHEDNRRHSQRHEEPQRDERESGGQNGRESSQTNGASESKSDRLPSMNSLPAPMDISTNRNSQDEGEMQSSMAPQGSPPLSLPSSGPLRSISVNDNGKPNSSSSHGASSPGTGSAMGTAGASLPPLSSGRSSSSLPRLNQDSKDMSSSGGMSTGLLGSSLTKFGRAPPTPVANSGVPSSLPSPLSTRKPGNSSGMVHSGRSPRLSKPSTANAFKSIQMPVPNSNYGPMEQVPSPGSLPVLPPMSRPGTNYNEEDKMGNKEKRPEETEREGDHRTESHHRSDSRMKYGEDKSDKEVNENNGHGRGVSDDVLENKPVFGVLRPGNNTNGEKEIEREEEKHKSPATSPNRGNGEGSMSNKRDSLMKEDMGRTPKRPRLHEVNDKDMNSKSYGGYNNEVNDEQEKSKEISQRKDEDVNKNGNGGMNNKQELGNSFKDLKGDRRSGSGSQEDGKKLHRRDSGGGRSGDGELPKNGLSSSQVIELPRELPRLSNQPMSKLSGPPMSGNQPLPSFRSERGKNLASRSGAGGSSSVGKSLTSENSSRGSLPFALRSAPAPVASIPSLKGLSSGGGSSARGSGGERGDYESSPRMGDSSASKRDDKTDGSMTRSGGRDRD